MKVFSDGAFMICSAKLGQSHGLSIEFEEDFVGVYLYKKGIEVASFSFDERFQELKDEEVSMATVAHFRVEGHEINDTR